ncbi:alpha/beta hydrolase [Microterricola viridarii]|uniref:Acetyl esterase/lipase n=1 Tax=Microterricola viridarii TaxID=412690 RepID=A0A1H1PKD5_9MICO|nr:alpha/beta hydrolase [Microterricola viridarii]SDS11550.1 Acetyl esterase/lipase [Microterricola viridarii]
MSIITIPETGYVFPQFRPPVSAGRSPVPAGTTAHLGLSYALLEGYRELGLDLYVPTDRPGPVPCVIWIHGGAWLSGDRRYFPDIWPEGIVFDGLIARGYAVATIDYRHAREASFPAQLHDAKAAVRYLRHFAAELGIDPTRFAVWGESAGGHLAALVGLVSGRPELEGSIGVAEGDSSVSAVVDWYGVSDVATMPAFADAALPDADPHAEAEGAWRGEEPIDVVLAGVADREAAERDFSPVSHVSASAPPFLLVHGDSDGLVPIGQSVLLHERLRAAGAPVHFHPVPGADHVWIGVDMQPLVTEALDFLEGVLGG